MPTPEVASSNASQAFALLGALTGLTTQRTVSPARFSALVDHWAPGPLDRQINFLTEVQALLRNLPVQVFCDVESRLAILQAAQEALDAMIVREEAGRPPAPVGRARVGAL